MLKLKTLLHTHGIKQSDLAVEICVSPATVAQIVNHNAWPKSMDKTALKAQIHIALRAAGIPDHTIFHAFEVMPPADSTNKKDEPCANTTHPIPAEPSANREPANHEEDSMLLRKQSLFPATRKHFSLFRDPFQDDIHSHEDLFVSPDTRYVREAMFQTAKNGGLLAVVAESGAGKTTLLRDLDDRIARENHPILLIKPYVLAMEDNDRKGKTLKASHIAEALMAVVAPLERMKSSPEARFAQLHKALRESHAAGFRHCLVIDEAHSLPIPTIKHLKRFFELEIGFKKLLSIILIGQPELKAKLSERNQDVREVVQRCELVELTPLDGARLDDYLRFKFDRLGKPMEELIDASGVDALRARLTIASGRRDRPDTVSLLYPLAVGNLLTAAMNLAAEIGVPTVTADVIKGV